MSDQIDTGGAAAARPPELRIGDAERESVIDQLRIHTGAGRLTLDEFSERADAVWRATTASELGPLLADLPAPRPDGAPPPPSAQQTATTAAPPAPTAATAPAPAPRAAGRSSIIGIMSENKVRGRWEVAPELSAFAMWGGVKIDLRQAIIRSPVVDIRATVLMGGLEIIVPEGIPVEVSGMVLMGGCSNRVRSELAMPGAPLIRVHAAGMWGGISIRSKPNRMASAEPDEDDRHERLDRHLDRTAEHVERAMGRAQDHVERALDRADRHAHRHGRHSGPPALPPLPTSPFPPPPVPSAAPAPAAEPEPATPPSSSVPLDLPEGTLTMLFTDIVDSTSAAERMGDQRWGAVLDHHDRTVRAVVAGHNGTVVKGSGDGYLVVFASARQAVLAAIAIQRATRSVDAAGPEGPVPLRAGLHTGEVVQRDGDVFGRNVIAASRIASEAESGQVLVSALTKELVESAGDLAFSDGVEVSLRGLARPWTLHEVHQAGPA